MSNSKGQWGSNFGFLMAAIGSAVGLGNLWGFPYKMGKMGGFAFLLIYLILVVFVGFVMVLCELSLGRKTGKGVVYAYRELGKKYTWIGFMGALSPFLILTFYSVLGGYCLKFMAANVGDIFHAGFGVNGVDSKTFFFDFIGNQGASIAYHVVFMVLTIFIVVGGVSKGIESFSKIAMPALFVMLCITIVRSVTLPGAMDGIMFILKPNFEVFKSTGWISVLASAGGQMFFSLSLGMGIMVTYGSYVSKNESLEFNALLIPIADTVIAVMAAFAIMPAVFALDMDPASGPMLLFVTLQAVFSNMGAIGPFFGLLFYTLVFIAAITSSVSILEAVISSWLDWMHKRTGHAVSRTKHTILMGIVILLIGCVVAADGLGSTGMYQPLGFCWLDFFDLLSEGIMMPLGSLMTAIIIGWVVTPKFIETEITCNGNQFRSKKFFNFCLKFVTPVVMVLVFVGQIDTFFKLGIF